MPGNINNGLQWRRRREGNAIVDLVANSELSFDSRNILYSLSLSVIAFQFDFLFCLPMTDVRAGHERHGQVGLVRAVSDSWLLVNFQCSCGGKLIFDLSAAKWTRIGVEFGLEFGLELLV